VVPAFVGRALAGEPLTIAGDGSQSRRFVYVEDLANGVVRALAPAAANRTYNLVGTEDVTIRQIAEAVRAAVGDVEICHSPGRTGDFAGAPVSADRAAEELGWRATTPFAEGLRRYVAWHRAEPSAPVAVRRLPELVPVARRAALSLLWAAATAVMIIGVATLTPVDSDMDRYDTFFGSLVVALPIVLAGGFHWDGPAANWLRASLWAAAGGWLVIAIAPWPGALDHLGHGHGVLLVLFALAAGIAARLTTVRPALPTWLGAQGE
jgi:hypothetical protein